MIHQELIDYIKKQLNSGVKKEDIKSALISAGWSEQNIEETFSVVPEKQPIPMPPMPEVQSTENISEPAVEFKNTIWTKGIPRFNWVCMTISLLLVFGVDLLIIISSPELSPFWLVMLGVFAVFAIFFYLENFVFKRKFASTASSLDKWILVIIVLRNLIFILNFIPLIQLLGMGAIFYIGWLIGLIYLGLMIPRFISIKNASNHDFPASKQQKRVSFLIPLLIILAVVLGIGGYFIYKRISAPKYQNSNSYEAITPSINQNTQYTGIEGWIRYDSGRGFEIKHPEKTDVSTVNIDGGTVALLQVNTDGRKRVFEIQRLDYPQKCSSTSGADALNVQIDGVDFIRYYESRNYSGSVSTSAYKYCAVVGNITYNLIPRIESPNSFEAETDPILNNMLSSFKIFR